MKPSITSPKLRDLASAIDKLDTIRKYFDDGQQQRYGPDEIVIHIPDGCALEGNKLFAKELSITVLKDFPDLYWKTMRRLEKEVDEAASSVGLIINDPKRQTL